MDNVYKSLIQNMFLLLSLGLIHIPALAQDNENIALGNEYYNEGEFEKARVLYEDLLKNKKNIPLIHKNYFNLLLNTGDYEQAHQYIDDLIRYSPENMYYMIDKGRIFIRSGSKEAEKQYFATIYSHVQDSEGKTRIAAQYMNNNQLFEYALETYKNTRKNLRDDVLFSLEMANSYRFLNMNEKMVEEYLNYVQSNPANIGSIKNILQGYLSEPEELVRLETYLIEKVQKEPDNQIFNDMLIWVYLQQKNFYSAFMQARAIDKRLKTNGDNVMDVGIIALNNRDYKTAIRIFDYIIEEFPSTINYPLARSYVIKAREELIKNRFPVDKVEIRKLIDDYQYLIDEIGINQTTLDAMRSMALLHAFYLDQYDTSIVILQKILDYPGLRLSRSLKARTKLDLGDIYLLIGQPWESTLLYSQVEKSEKETPVAYEAKLRNAKLSYYQGEFNLAEDHLDILKEATTREIANDAISLSLLIKDNTLMDTTHSALKRYSGIDLLLFQNKKQQALDSLNLMLKEFGGHSLADEIYWLMSKIKLELGNFQESIDLLEKINLNYSEDILADDAFFMMGKIYEEQLDDSKKAMEIYQQFLKDYPGSIYSAEARKRFRKLRGDFMNTTN